VMTIAPNASSRRARASHAWGEGNRISPSRRTFIIVRIA